MRAELRRTARRQLAHALHAARATERPLAARVHVVRTALKKVRSLLRLVRSTLPGARHEERRLARLARRLGPARDVTIIGRHVRGVAKGADDATEAVLEGLERPLRRARRRAGRWKLRAGGLAALEDGLRDSYRRVLRVAPSAFASADPAELHAVRKLVKAQLHQTRWLSRLWPEGTTARLAALDRLDRLLGDDHDLTLLETVATAGRRSRLAAEHAVLRAEARQLATTLFTAQDLRAAARRRKSGAGSARDGSPLGHRR